MYFYVFLYVMYFYNFSIIVQWLRSTIEHFTLGTLQTWNWMPFFLNIAWNVLFAPICSHTDRLSAYLFRIIGEHRSKCRAYSCTLFDRSGTMCNFFKKLSIALNIYLYLSSYLLRDCISFRSHSQTSITFLKVYAFLGNRLRTNRCNVYESCFKSYDWISRLDCAYLTAACFCTVENAEGREGE